MYIIVILLNEPHASLMRREPTRVMMHLNLHFFLLARDLKTRSIDFQIFIMFSLYSRSDIIFQMHDYPSTCVHIKYHSLPLDLAVVFLIEMMINFFFFF